MVKGQWLRLLDIFPVEFPVRHCMKSFFFESVWDDMSLKQVVLFRVNVEFSRKE